jgi:hypothetical protein
MQLSFEKSLQNDYDSFLRELNNDKLNENSVTSKFEIYRATVDDLFDQIDLYSLIKFQVQIDDLLKKRTVILKLIEEISYDRMNHNKPDEELKKILQVVYDWINIIENYKKPLYVEKNFTIFIQDRATSANLQHSLFKNLSSFLYTKSNLVFTVKPGITLKCKTNLIRQTGNMLIINAHECISIAKNYLVFLDIIEAPIVFNKHDPIIKIVKPEGAYTDYISKNYDNPHYIKVNKNIIYKIQVQIKDQNHKFINFNSGPVSLKLHFRKIRR